MSHSFVKQQVALIKYKGRFDLDGLFSYVFNWLQEHEFPNFNEEVFKHKMPEIEKKLIGYKKRTGYIAEYVTFECHFFGLKPIEVVENGKKKKMYEGRGEMKFTFELVTDWENRWETSPFWVKMRNVFDKHIIRKNLLFEYVDPLEKKTQSLVEDVKNFLGMEGAR